jgi:hypothetical protein
MKDKLDDFKSKLNNTNLLLEDSISSNKFYSSYIKRNNNTELLLNDKTSMITEVKALNNITTNSELLKLSHFKQSEIKSPDTLLQSIKTSKDGSIKYKTSDNKFISLSEESIDLGDSKANNKTLDLSDYYLDFGFVFPGEILQKIVRLRNTSNAAVKVYFNFSQERNLSHHFNDGKINIRNSYLKYKCFELKNIIDENVIYIQPYQELELNLCFTCPTINSHKKFYSVLEIHEMSDNTSKEYDKRNSLLLKLQAAGEIPKLLCLRKKDEREKKINSEYPLILLDLNSKLREQRFRIPLKNFSLKDMKLDLFWDKASIVEVRLNNEKLEFDFRFDTSQINVYSLSASYMEILVKSKDASDYLNISNDSMILKDKIDVISSNGKYIKKLIYANLRSTNVIYTFILLAKYN